MPALPLAVRIHQYLRTLAPHMREREAATLLAEAEDELDRISEREFVEQGLAAIMGGWIPVSEQLPPDEVRVLAFDGQDVFESECVCDGWEWGAIVTHWQPLPEPPTP